jgi:hypothetical protein
MTEILGRSVYFVTYEGLKRHLAARRRSSFTGTTHRHDLDKSNLASFVPLHERMACAACAGILSWSVVFPFDSLRSRMFAREPPLQHAVAAAAGSVGHGPHDSTAAVWWSSSPRRFQLASWYMARHMYREGGWKAFYRGYAVTVVRSGPVAAAVLPIYDLTLAYLSSVDC